MVPSHVLLWALRREREEQARAQVRLALLLQRRPEGNPRRSASLLGPR